MNRIKTTAVCGLIGLASLGLVSASCDGGGGGASASDDVVAVESGAFRIGAPDRHHVSTFPRPGRSGGPGTPGSCVGSGGVSGGGSGGAGGRAGLGGVSGSAGRGGPAGGAVGSGSVAITPNETGWIAAATNPLGIQGAWYPFADGYGLDGLRDGQCEAAGHADSECSVVTTPDPAMHSFPNTGGTMCTAGSAALVLLSNGALDYANMWGAGMGFDLAGAGAGQPRGTFDAQASGIIGVSFDIDTVPLTGLRVMFATAADGPGTVGPAYWGASQFYPPSPVVPGTNVVLFSQVQSPEATPRPLDLTQLEAMQFLVPAGPSSATPFSYCVSNVKMLLR